MAIQPPFFYSILGSFQSRQKADSTGSLCIARLGHMLDSTRAILTFLQNRKRSDLDSDRLLSSGIIREFMILGEAAGKISEKTQKQYPELPWKQLIGMRNRLIHAYFEVDNEIIWMTAKNKLPNFCIQLEAIVSEMEAGP